MNKIIDLYLSRKDVPTRFDVVQGAQAPGITFVLRDYEPSAGATARIFIKKSESEVYNTCTLSGNEVTYNPTVTSFDEPGKCTGQLEIVSGGKIAMSYMLYINVEPNIIDASAIEAADDFSALQDAILAVGDISEYKAQTEQNTADIDAIEGKLDKIHIRTEVEGVYFGQGGETKEIQITGDSTDKIKIMVENNQEIGRFMFQVKADALALYEQNAAVELFRINGPYTPGTITVANCVGSGYSTATNGTYYFYFDTPRTLPSGATLSNVQITSATVRGGGGQVTSLADITSNVSDLIRGSSGKPRVLLTGLTTNFVASMPAFITCTLKFTLA